MSLDFSALPSLDEVIREIDRRDAVSFASFAKMAWHVLEPSTDLKWGWALDAICDHLEAVSRGEILRLLMNVPPGSMKSLLTGVLFPAWEWGPCNKQGLRYLGTAHAAHLSIRDSLKCRRLIQSQWYQDRWPITLTSDQNAKTKFENAQSGFREAMAFEGMTGSRGDRVLIDDPHSVVDANSTAKLESGVRTFREALPSRVNNEKSAIVIIMQRLHEADISAVALDLGYEHLCIPMEFEPSRRHHTCIGWTDLRTDEGELMFPERFPAEVVERDKRALGSYAYAGQMQQRPSPAGGGIIKGDWWRYYEVPPQITHRIVFADTAQKTKEQNDYSVFQCWGYTKTKQALIIDQIRGKWEAPELLVQARAFWAKHVADRSNGALRAFKVEDKVSGTGLIQTLKREGVPMIEIKRITDKVTRAMDAAPYIESGNVLLPKQAAWLSDFLAEAEAFPNGAHDDQIDPMCDAVAEIHESGRTPGMLVKKGNRR